MAKELLELLKTRRSLRKYKAEQVKTEELDLSLIHISPRAALRRGKKARFITVIAE